MKHREVVFILDSL